MTDRTIAPLFTWRSAVVTSDLTATQRHVALTLSLYMNERGGSAYPGAGRLANDCDLHVSTVRRVLSELTNLGWLQLVSKGGKRGERKQANEYVATRPQPVLPLAQDDGSHRTTGRTGLTDPSHRTTPPLAQDDPSTSWNSSLNTPADAVEEQFEAWWQVYPDRNGRKIGKGNALIEWRKLSVYERRRAYRGAVHLAGADTLPKDPERFLRRAKGGKGDFPFDDWQTAPDRPRGPSGAKPDVDAEVAPDDRQIRKDPETGQWYVGGAA